VYQRTAGARVLVGKCWFYEGENSLSIFFSKSHVDPASGTPECFSESVWTNKQTHPNNQDPGLPNEPPTWHQADGRLDVWKYRNFVDRGKVEISVTKVDPVSKTELPVYFQDPDIGPYFNDLPPVLLSVAENTSTKKVSSNPCDLDMNGICNSDDRELLAASMGRSRGEAGYSSSADMDGDGYVDREDYRLAFCSQADACGSFHTLTPCRVADTRNPQDLNGGPILISGEPRLFSLRNHCGIPPAADAVSVNITVVSPTTNGHLTFYSGGPAPPQTSTINFGPGQTRANNAILPLSPDGELTVLPLLGAGQVHLIIDVSGYFD
jgi:hypothetical protein